MFFTNSGFIVLFKGTVALYYIDLKVVWLDGISFVTDLIWCKRTFKSIFSSKTYASQKVFISMVKSLSLVT